MQIGTEALWERQYQLTSILTRAGVSQILEGLVDLSNLSQSPVAAQPWQFANHWNGQNPELQACPKVDAIKASSNFLFRSVLR